jgi:Short C-terminal domain
MSYDADAPAPDLEEVEQETVLERFETPNPWLQKLFNMPHYGTVPAVALGLLREVSPDHEERLLAAVKCEHGRLRRGYLLATTKCLRWVRTFPNRGDDTWGYEYKLDYKGISVIKAVLILGTGDQFQTYKARAKPFAAMYNVILEANAWEAGHADEQLALAVTTPAPSLADKLRELAALHQQGVLTPEEFAAAKQKLMA